MRGAVAKKHPPRPREWVSYNMSRIRGKNTVPEVLLRKTLSRCGLRFRLHGDYPGRPDIVFPGARVAVFCDGGFWHGRNFSRTKRELRRNRKFWVDKISANIARDRKVNRMLRKDGWEVIRLWDADIGKDPEGLARKICQAVETRRRSGNGV